MGKSIVKELLLLWKESYKIPLSYNEDIWDISKRALAGEAGVYTHNSVRKDKVDIYPHPKMIEQSLSLTPMKRAATGDDIAAAIVFLATGTNLMTGQIIVVDGGRTM